jgi:hypothetical protein
MTLFFEGEHKNVLPLNYIVTIAFSYRVNIKLIGDYKHKEIFLVTFTCASTF